MPNSGLHVTSEMVHRRQTMRLNHNHLFSEKQYTGSKKHRSIKGHGFKSKKIDCHHFKHTGT